MSAASGRALQVVIGAAALKWQDRAACAEIGTEAFFPEHGANRIAVGRARAVCAQCPVEAECLEYALDVEARPGVFGRHGIYGGKSPDERRTIALSRKQGAAA